MAVFFGAYAVVACGDDDASPVRAADDAGADGGTDAAPDAQIDAADAGSDAAHDGAADASSDANASDASDANTSDANASDASDANTSDADADDASDAQPAPSHLRWRYVIPSSANLDVNTSSMMVENDKVLMFAATAGVVAAPAYVTVMSNSFHAKPLTGLPASEPANNLRRTAEGNLAGLLRMPTVGAVAAHTSIATWDPSGSLISEKTLPDAIATAQTSKTWSRFDTNGSFVVGIGGAHGAMIGVDASGAQTFSVDLASGNAPQIAFASDGTIGAAQLLTNLTPFSPFTLRVTALAADRTVRWTHDYQVSSNTWCDLESAGDHFVLARRAVDGSAKLTRIATDGAESEVTWPYATQAFAALSSGEFYVVPAASPPMLAKLDANGVELWSDPLGAESVGAPALQTDAGHVYVVTTQPPTAPGGSLVTTVASFAD